jgi:hypothetical protein
MHVIVENQLALNDEPIVRAIVRLMKQGLSMANCNSAKMRPRSAVLYGFPRLVEYQCMRELFILVAHLLATLAKLMRPGGVRSVVAESLLLKHQLLTLKRSRKGAPKLTPWDRLLVGFGSACVSPARVTKIAIALRPSTFLRFYQALARLKYHVLYASRPRH